MTVDRGVLYVVATPIGNLEDITIRALNVLRRVHVIACEDTRTTRVLLRKWDISTRTMSLHRFSEARKSAKIIELLENGLDIALVSDAGTPAISDPGNLTVRAVSDRGFKVTPVPGPSSIAAALSVSGVSGPAFVYLGFAPRKNDERRRFFELVRGDARPSVFFETAMRIKASLSIAAEIIGDRRMVLLRELTKLHEEIITGTAAEVVAAIEDRSAIKGEIVVVVEGAAGAEPISDLDVLVQSLIDEGLTGKHLAAEAHARFGVKKSDAYKQFLELTGKGGRPIAEGGDEGSE